MSLQSKFKFDDSTPMSDHRQSTFDQNPCPYSNRNEIASKRSTNLYEKAKDLASIYSKVNRISKLTKQPSRNYSLKSQSSSSNVDLLREAGDIYKNRSLLSNNNSTSSDKNDKMSKISNINIIFWGRKQPKPFKSFRLKVSPQREQGHENSSFIMNNTKLNEESKIVPITISLSSARENNMNDKLSRNRMKLKQANNMEFEISHKMFHNSKMK